MVRKGIEEEQASNHGRVIAELTEKYMQQIFEKNRQSVDIARVKEEIETQITSVGSTTGNDSDVKRLQDELDTLLVQYEKLVADKIKLFSQMISNLREISRNNESVVCADEEISRLKTNMDFVKRDIYQKKRMLGDQK